MSCVSAKRCTRARRLGAVKSPYAGVVPYARQTTAGFAVRTTRTSPIRKTRTAGVRVQRPISAIVPAARTTVPSTAGAATSRMRERDTPVALPRSLARYTARGSQVVRFRDPPARRSGEQMPAFAAVTWIDNAKRPRSSPAQQAALPPGCCRAARRVPRPECGQDVRRDVARPLRLGCLDPRAVPAYALDTVVRRGRARLARPRLHDRGARRPHRAHARRRLPLGCEVRPAADRDHGTDRPLRRRAPGADDFSGLTRYCDEFRPPEQSSSWTARKELRRCPPRSRARPCSPSAGPPTPPPTPPPF